MCMRLFVYLENYKKPLKQFIEQLSVKRNPLRKICKPKSPQALSKLEFKKIWYKIGYTFKMLRKKGKKSAFQGMLNLLA